MFSIKLNFNGEVRRSQLPSIGDSKLSFSLLTEKAKALFSIESSLKFLWKDDEGDSVCCSTDEELTEAIRVMSADNKKNFKFDISLCDLPDNQLPQQSSPLSVNEMNSIVSDQSIFHGVTCDNCGICPIVGVRFKCVVRDNFDLCSKCEALSIPPFPVLKIFNPDQSSLLNDSVSTVDSTHSTSPHSFFGHQPPPGLLRGPFPHGPHGPPHPQFYPPQCMPHHPHHHPHHHNPHHHHHHDEPLTTHADPIVASAIESNFAVTGAHDATVLTEDANTDNVGWQQQQHRDRSSRHDRCQQRAEFRHDRRAEKHERRVERQVDRRDHRAARGGGFLRHLSDLWRSPSTAQPVPTSATLMTPATVSSKAVVSVSTPEKNKIEQSRSLSVDPTLLAPPTAPINRNSTSEDMYLDQQLLDAAMLQSLQDSSTPIASSHSTQGVFAARPSDSYLSVTARAIGPFTMVNSTSCTSKVTADSSSATTTSVLASLPQAPSSVPSSVSSVSTLPARTTFASVLSSSSNSNHQHSFFGDAHSTSQNLDPSAPKILTTTATVSNKRASSASIVTSATSTNTSTSAAGAPTPLSVSQSFGPQAKPMARFVRDVTFPDGTNVQPGSTLQKTWRVRNDGTCAWPAGVVLVCSGGDQLAPSDLNLSVPAIAPGEEVDISVLLAVPESTGRHVAYFRLRTKDDSFFGQRLWADIRVTETEYDWQVVSGVMAYRGEIAPSLSSVKGSESLEVKSSDSQAINKGSVAAIQPTQPTLEEELAKGSVVEDEPCLPTFDEVPVISTEPSEPWGKELALLRDMGFYDRKLIMPLLETYLPRGSEQLPRPEGMQRVVAILLGVSGTVMN